MPKFKVLVYDETDDKNPVREEVHEAKNVEEALIKAAQGSPEKRFDEKK